MRKHFKIQYSLPTAPPVAGIDAKDDDDSVFDSTTIDAKPITVQAPVIQPRRSLPRFR